MCYLQGTASFHLPDHVLFKVLLIRCFLFFLSVVQNEDLPPLLRIQRVPTPKWAVAEDQKALEELQRKHEVAMSLEKLHDKHFSNFEGNLDVQRARTAILASRLKPPNGWGGHHTHVSVSLDCPR